MKLHQIRNATMIIEYGGKRFLTDPMLAPKESYTLLTDKPWPLHDLAVFPKDVVKNIDAVIISHLHTDHFDKFAQDLLPKGIKIFVQDIFDKNALEKEHFKNIEVLKEEGSEFEGVKLFKTECLHGIRATAEPIFLANGMRWEAMGIALKSKNEPTIYLAGDTIWYEGIRKAIDTHKPEYLVLNTSCTKIGRDEKVLMGIEDIKALHEYYPEGKLIAVHMDCVSYATLSRADLRTSEVKDYIYAPADGEIIFPNRVK